MSDGRVFFWGGSTTFVYALSVSTDTVVDLPASLVALERHSVTLLPSGRYLGAGNVQTDLERVLPGASPYAAVYDVSTGAQTRVEMLEGRGLHASVLLPDGRVLLIGGAFGAADGLSADALERCEFFSEATGAFSAAPSLATGRYAHTATRLPSGVVVVTGGRGDDGRSLASVELFDPATGAWRTAAPMATARARHVAVLLGSGRVLVAGGTTGASEGVTATAEVYDPALDRWSTVEPLPIGVGGAGAAALPNGDAIVTGGFASATPPIAIRQAVVFRDATSRWQSMPDMQQARYDHSTVVLTDGHVLVGVGWDRNPYFGIGEGGLEVSDDAFVAP